MRIGIPRALIYYFYYPFFKRLFEELGMEVVVSPKTSKSILNKGIEYSASEICVPMKIFSGHVVYLLDKVDYIFVPRMMKIGKNEYFCPKFMGLPDMIKYTIPRVEHKLLSPKIQSLEEDISNIKNYKDLIEKLPIKYKDLKRALKMARKEWKDFRKISKSGYTIDEIMENKIMEKTNEKVNIGLLGYVYNVYDEYISMNIISKLKSLGVRVKTFEMIEEKELDRSIDFMRKKLFWTFSNRLLGAGYHFFSDNNIDGVIHLTAFGCGPDSFIGKVLEIDSDNYKTPFMTIRIDEHTGENHLLTRIEAFVDMIKRKKMGVIKGENDFSSHGKSHNIQKINRTTGA
ncbi:MAG: acyl-CoA dehydratase activase-related protein [Anaeromicrobium sp.]|uniref:acyl-CoA dehydratase activase-related protein n=1 Tax=Anaeromicrobium sp. TaxID=1929132 RepID=UPI0025D2E9BF|nr:acyl-CoA dehydratase activase-related protein [Anaeromicrobium sp.]MCT4595070.1 acyl-CoA dehydratase activase-related protein [Anaeromicrobium sp.]